MSEFDPGSEAQHVSGETKSTMSEPGTLANIFFEPGRTFESLRQKPKFLMAGILIILSVVAFQILFTQRMGPERFKRFMIEQIDKNPRAASMSAEDKAKIVDQQLSFQWVGTVITPIFVAVFLLVGGLLYWAGAKAMGGELGFLGALSVWIYSSFPAAIVSTVANLLILYLKDPDDIDMATANQGLLHANPTFFFDGKEMPVLSTIIATLDVFTIWKWILGAIGLAVVARMSKGSAWAVILFVALIGLGLRVGISLLSGAPS